MVVVAGLGRAVRAPPLELHPVAEPPALELSERDLDDAFDAEWHEREILVDVPTREPARHPLGAVGLRLCPSAPRVPVEGVFRQRAEFVDQFAAKLRAERSTDAHMMEPPVVAVQPEQQ